MIDKHVIIGVHITDRVEHAGGVQKILSEYGCNIRTRVGLHDIDGKYCSPNGLVLLEAVGEKNEVDELAAKLSSLQGVEVKTMVFDHP